MRRASIDRPARIANLLGTVWAIGVEFDEKVIPEPSRLLRIGLQ